MAAVFEECPFCPQPTVAVAQTFLGYRQTHARNLNSENVEPIWDSFHFLTCTCSRPRSTRACASQNKTPSSEAESRPYIFQGHLKRKDSFSCFVLWQMWSNSFTVAPRWGGRRCIFAPRKKCICTVSRMLLQCRRIPSKMQKETKQNARCVEIVKCAACATYRGCNRKLLQYTVVTNRILGTKNVINFKTIYQDQWKFCFHSVQKSLCTTAF